MQNWVIVVKSEPRPGDVTRANGEWQQQDGHSTQYLTDEK